MPQPDEIARLRVDALLAEYGTLRAEIASRRDHRQQTITVAGVAAGLVLGFSPGSALSLPWIFAIAAVLLTSGIVIWFDAGRSIGALSERAAQIEQDVEDVLRGDFVADKTMTWERSRQPRRGLGRIFLGEGKAPHSPRKGGAL